MVLCSCLRADSHTDTEKAKDEAKVSGIRENIHFRDTMFQKLWQKVQFATGVGTHSLHWSGVMSEVTDVGVINTGARMEGV